VVYEDALHAEDQQVGLEITQARARRETRASDPRSGTSGVPDARAQVR